MSDSIYIPCWDSRKPHYELKLVSNGKDFASEMRGNGWTRVESLEVQDVADVEIWSKDLVHYVALTGAFQGIFEFICYSQKELLQAYDQLLSIYEKTIRCCLIQEKLQKHLDEI